VGRVFAAADIGSNTAHILVAEANGRGTVRRISDANEWVSLGEIVGKTGEIPPETEALLVKSLRAFRRLAHLHGAESLYVFGTEALRKARNSSTVLKSLERETGIRVELIDGPREAHLGLRGAWTDTSGTTPFTLCEVGGGSAQVGIAQAGPAFSESVSLPLGTGILIARCALELPAAPVVLKCLEEAIEAELDRVNFLSGSRLVGCGGVARGLWRALHPDGNRQLLAEELDYLIWATQRINAETTRTRFNVKAKRAFTLLPGAMVYRAVMRRGGFGQLEVSRYGVREGAILEMSEGKVTGCAP
jgi:exopolyphosphatase / guanosine-5'-triphosphate,3'-diphosphate pyrophosphatase